MKSCLAVACSLWAASAIAGSQPTVTVHVESIRVGPEGAYVHAVMPDDSNVLLKCDLHPSKLGPYLNQVLLVTVIRQKSIRDCPALEPGDYEVEISKNAVFFIIELITGKQEYSWSGMMLPRRTQVKKVRYTIIAAEQP